MEYMEYIDDLKSLLDLIRSRKEVIVYVLGGEGTRFLDYLYYVGRSGGVLCATQSPGSTKQQFIATRPLIPLNCLAHFRESATFIVAAPPAKHEDIESILEKFGVKSYVFLSGVFHENVKNWIDSFANSVQIALWATKDLANRMDQLEQRVAEQFEISEAHVLAFAEYRNSFRDKEIVLVSTGASLKYYEPIPDAIHIGVSLAWRREDIPLDFLFTHNIGGNRAAAVRAFGKIAERIFIGKYPDAGVTNHLNSPVDVEFMSDNIYRYYPVPSPNVGQIIYQDICHHNLADFWTVGSAALHFALFTCPSKIYLAGFDATFAGPFYDEKKPPKTDLTHIMKLGYARLKMFAQKYYRQTEIISINPIGLKGLFKDEFTDEFRATLEKPVAVPAAAPLAKPDADVKAPAEKAPAKKAAKK